MDSVLGILHKTHWLQPNYSERGGLMDVLWVEFAIDWDMMQTHVWLWHSLDLNAQ